MQSYHTNAVTNIHVRSAIQASKLSSEDLSLQYGISKTVYPSGKADPLPLMCPLDPSILNMR